VVMFCESSQQCPDLEWGDREAHDNKGPRLLRAHDIYREVQISPGDLSQTGAVADTTGSRDTSSFRWKPLLAIMGTMVASASVVVPNSTK